MPGWKTDWDVALRSLTEDVDSAAARNRSDLHFLREPTVYRPIVGTDQPTRQSAVVAGDEVRIEWNRGGSNEAGDGTVPLLSAALTGTEEQRTFAPEQHGRLQNYQAMLNHFKGVLTALYQVRVDDLRGQVNAWLSYRADDVYLPGEPVTFELGACSSMDQTMLPHVDTRLEVTSRATGEVVHDRRLRVPRTNTTYEIIELPPGTYTLKVTGRRDTAPVSDVLVVADPVALERETRTTSRRSRSRSAAAPPGN